MPIDVPMIDSKQPMKFDVVENRASVPWKGDRAALVELLTKHSSAFGWQLVNSDDYLQDKTFTLYVSQGSPIGLAARIVESAGVYYLSLERVKLPTKETQDASEAANKIAQTNTAAEDAAAKKMKSQIESQIDATESAINKAVSDELAKALGSLSTGASKTDMQALQAQAAKLQAHLNAADETPADAPKAKPTNVQDVPDDKEPLSPEDANIKVTEARIKLGARELVLKHCLAYARMEDGEPTKIMLFSDKPLSAEKLDKLCARGESFMIYDGFGSNRPDASLELRISGNNVMMNFAADGLSSPQTQVICSRVCD